ncbi:MAG: hypothetical protein GY820_39405 [Gammaproteobacteria bacterium]|nr:hypothetical protein [Gammaproteobacteria bacterium]
MWYFADTPCPVCGKGGYADQVREQAIREFREFVMTFVQKYGSEHAAIREEATEPCAKCGVCGDLGTIPDPKGTGCVREKICPSCQGGE